MPGLSGDPRQRRDDCRLRVRAQLAPRGQVIAGSGEVVIGAGPAGLAVGAMLRRRGRKPIVLERAGRVGESWRTRYDCLRLNTARWWSGLPGMAIPRQLGTWVSAADYARDLERDATDHE